MSNRTINLGARLQGNDGFLEIQSFNTDNFSFDANSQVNLADSLVVQDLTINGNFTNAGGGAISSSTATYSTSVTTPKIIATDNNANGLVIESSDGADFIVCDTQNGAEKIDLKKDTNTGGNKITMGTNGSRGQFWYGDIRNTTIGDTNTLSANTSGTSASWASSRTISFRNSANGNAAMGSVAFDGTGDVNADIDILDQTNSSAHKFIIANTETGHTSTNLQQRIDFINAQDSNITRSDNLVGKISVVNDNMSFIIYDKSHSSNSSLLQLTKNNADDIPNFNSFLHFSTQADGERYMNIENNNTTYDDTTARRQYPTSIHLGNAGNYQDSVVGNTIAKLKANWRADGEGQVELLARQNTSSAAHECGFLITSDSGGGTALDVPITATEMVMKGQKLGAIHDVDYFNGMKVGHAAMVGNGLQILTSGGSVVSGAPSAYGNAIHPKLKSGGGLAVDGDGLYSTAGGEFTAGSGNEIIASPHKVMGLIVNSLTGSKLTGFSGTDTTLKSGFNHIFGSMDTDNTDAVNGGLTILGYNEGTGGNVGGHSQLVLQNAHTESTDGLCDEIGVFRLENEGDLTIQMGKKQETNTDQIYNGSNGVVYDKIKMFREGGVMVQMEKFAGTDAVLSNFETNNMRGSAGDDKFALYNATDNMTFEMVVGRNNLTSGTDLASNAVSTPSGFQIVHQQGGDTILNNNKTKAIIFQVGGTEYARFHDNGRLGIGTTAPICAFENYNSSSIGWAGLAYFGNGTTGIVAGTYSNVATFGGHNHDLTIWTDIAVQTGGGKMGLGTSSPACKLDVQGTTYLSGGSWRYFSDNAGDIGLTTYEGGSAVYTAIKSNGSIWINGSGTSSYFLTSSDSRIKTEIEIVNDAEALNIINSLETKKYHYTDPVKKKDLKTIGFIAQEVMEVLPNAVSIETEFIPDISKRIECIWEDNKLMNAIDLSGEEYTGRILFKSYEGDEVKDIIVNSDLVFEKQYSQLYCYGREVNNFHTIDKQQIFALHHSGIQELSRKVSLLETENNALMVENQNLLDKNTEFENKINNLETLINSLTNRVVINETTLQGLILNN